MSVESASATELLAFSLFLLIAATAAWLFAGFWGRMWTESLESRSVDRRFLRWQHFLFRGHYPLGHWSKPGSVGHLKVFVIVLRGFVILILVVWFAAVTRRVLVGPGFSHVNNPPSEAVGSAFSKRALPLARWVESEVTECVPA